MTQIKPSIQPLRDYILVEPVERAQSVELWTANYEKFCEGYVRAIGEGERSRKDSSRIPMATAVGDHIRYGNGTYLDWTTYLDNGKVYQLIREADVCAIVEDGKLNGN